MHRLDPLEPASDGSAYEDYVLTDKGRDLFPVMVALRQWGEDHCFLPGEPHSVLVENETGRRVGRLEIRSGNGRILKAPDTVVRKSMGSDTTPKRAGSSRQMPLDTASRKGSGRKA
jgi:hypothetical protein